ncbi:unnamed protein product [Triticum turgidum subsp. durum]|uniref:Probable magnesium transporter n=1 Tax=Triticum turgidum subsp. durum TaxID=4567 RepID=A0A9R0VCR7_TRITD|nr:unnamed protein product [Triticum turgidum subsp. durum]
MEGGMGGGGGGGQQELSADNVRGIVLALLSSGFIGSSFIIKKKGLRRAAVSSGISAGGWALLPPGAPMVGGHDHHDRGRDRQFRGVRLRTGGAGYSSGSTEHNRQCSAGPFHPEREAARAGGPRLRDVHRGVHGDRHPRAAGAGDHVCQGDLAHGNTTIFLAICCFGYTPGLCAGVPFLPSLGAVERLDLHGHLLFDGFSFVMSVKALGTSLKLTFEGTNQLAYPETWFFMLVVAICVLTQMNYLNKALDTFNTAVVSPIYYVMFTSLTILASIIMFKDWSGQSLGSITSEICGLIVVLSGTILLHVTKDYERIPQSRSLYAPLSPTSATRLNGELLRHVEEDVRRTNDEEKVLRRQEMY